jgi:hypothetical protein
MFAEATRNSRRGRCRWPTTSRSSCAACSRTRSRRWPMARSWPS